MKRTTLFLVMLIVLSLSGSACGSVFFTDGDSPVLHRDPLCLDIPPWSETLDLHTVVFSS